MKYAYLRLFLSQTEQPAVLIATGDVKERVTRSEHLKSALSNRIRFIHRGLPMDYVPIPLEKDEREGFVFGRIGRKKETQENATPEEKFENKIHVGWRASNLILDTTDHSDGQKIAMQIRGDVGLPYAILCSLFDHINVLNIDSGWHIDVNPITNKASFWEAVKRYEGTITRAEFTYVTPNVLGIRNELDVILRRYREHENAQTVSVALTEPHGSLRFDSQEVRDSVDYISEGGGSAKLKAGKEIVFDTAHKDQIRAFETDDKIEIVNKDNRKALIEKLFNEKG